MKKKIFLMIIIALFSSATIFAKKKKAPKEKKAPKGAIMLTYNDIVEGLMLKKALKENVISQEMVDELGTDVTADVRFKAYYLPANDAKELVLSIGAAKLNGLVFIQSYIGSKYWAVLKGAGRSMASLQETVNGLEDLENEETKVVFTEEQIAELKNMSDETKAELKKVISYRKFIKIMNMKTAANITAMSASTALILNDLIKRKKLASIKIIKYAIVNLKAIGKTSDERKKNKIALDKVEQAFEAAGIIIE